MKIKMTGNNRLWQNFYDPVCQWRTMIKSNATSGGHTLPFNSLGLNFKKKLRKDTNVANVMAKMLQNIFILNKCCSVESFY